MLVIAAIVLMSQSDVKSFQVDGVERTAIVIAPAKKTDHPPLVFGFHGHGGTARFVSRRFDIHRHWPEAVVIYPQGLPTATSRDRQGSRAGWQNVAGIVGDRDLKFFDAMLAEASKLYSVDSKRVYSMGHSNGAMMTYLLWQMRHQKLAAVAPVAGVFRERLGLEPLPCFVAGGLKDEVVRWDMQKAGMEAMSKFLAIDGSVDFTPRASATTYTGAKARMAVYIHEGAHEYPTAASGQIVEFFKKHAKK